MNTSLTTKRAIAYLRVSTPGQTGEHHSSLETQDNVPELITTFLEGFEAMDPRLRKAHLQTILKAAHITRGNIELEFRV